MVRLLTGIVRRIEAALLIIAFLLAGSTLYDMYVFTSAGRGTESFPGFEALISENPDTAAWISMDGTHINHPVVKGIDNFEYTSKGFDGKYYQGGCIFLDEKNARDMSDNYIIIHGHHMSGGAMMSDLANYLEAGFFEEYKAGELITPDAGYLLTVAGVKIVNAYEDEVYYTDPAAGMPLQLITGCIHMRDVRFCEGDKLIVLSTCSGDMTNDRIVLFCRAREI